MQHVNRGYLINSRFYSVSHDSFFSLVHISTSYYCYSFFMALSSLLVFAQSWLKLKNVRSFLEIFDTNFDALFVRIRALKEGFGERLASDVLDGYSPKIHLQNWEQFWTIQGPQLLKTPSKLKKNPTFKFDD